MPALDQESNAAEVINVSGEVVRFEIDGIRYKLSERERITIHQNYALPRHLKKDKDPLPSVIDMLTGGKVLHVEDKRARGAVVASQTKS